MVTLKDTAFNIASLRNQRLVNARAVLRKIVDILVQKYDVSRIVLIGSLAEGERFGFHSDIDLCVTGLHDELYFKAVGELLMETGEFDIDIIPFENATPEMMERIKKGKVLYEKRQAVS